MTLKINTRGRQWPTAAFVEVTGRHFGTGALDVPITIPSGALLQLVTFDLITPFSATPLAVTVHDDAGFSTGVTGVTAATHEDMPVNAFYPNGGTLTATFSNPGAPTTAGQAFVTATYLLLNRVDEPVT